jgi:hypothetical protein
MQILNPNRVWIAIAALAATALAGLALAAPALPSPDQANGAGVRLRSPTAMSWNGTVQVKPAGAVVELDGSPDASVDEFNAAGREVFVGRLDPDFRGRNAAGIIWMTTPGLAQ